VNKLLLSWFVSGADGVSSFQGVSTFQGAKTGVTTQIHEKWTPFSIGINYCSHRINLVVKTLSKYPMVSFGKAFLVYVLVHPQKQQVTC
jgi:hypothetical protein